VAAVEFALVAAPFFFLLFSILQIAFLFVLDSLLENATLQTARLVRTGQAVEREMTRDQFKATLCENMSIFAAECPNRVVVEVRELPQFRGPPPPNPVVNGALDEAALPYTNGQPGALVLVRVWYKQPLFVPTLPQAVSRADTGEVFINVTTAFRSEPYG
jgi:hypothetical protein